MKKNMGRNMFLMVKLTIIQYWFRCSFDMNRQQAMDLLPDTYICGLRMRRECGNFFLATDFKDNR